MKIQSFKTLHINKIAEKEGNRELGFSTFEEIRLNGRNHYYPNVLLCNKTNEYLISPYDEKIMSLNKDSFYDDNEYDNEYEDVQTSLVENPVFFFIYNFDNYYHFLYDTLPYLHTYFHLKKTMPTLKLLVQYPNPAKTTFYPFNKDILDNLGLIENLILHDPKNIYKTMFVSTSLTHGGFSNDPPRKEAYQIYDRMKPDIFIQQPGEGIYISRRTWINKNTTNIGTNYTTRRKMMNEDALAERLFRLGIREVFTENLTMDEKIRLFMSAKLVIGSIGGGMANLLFGNKQTKSIVIVTPEFLEINQRFIYSMENTDITYFYDVKTYKEHNEIPLYTRIRLNKENQVGEIVEYNPETKKYLVQLSNNDVAGFNNEIEFTKSWHKSAEFQLLDRGLNSPYIVNIDEFIKVVENRLKGKA